ncbi:MAG: cell division protein FtsK, partial [Phycisphaerae bacterium]|nr:cell division protein FtsK [Phycisphaerae bacterium]
PAGKARLTLLDPVGLGESYAGFMHLADVDEAPILRRVYSESRHIDEQLLDITDHMQNVIQTYLRNDYETIEEYNQHAGQIAEPYHFLVIADFPVNISEQSSKRLMSIIRSGTRCGVYTILLRDLRRPLPPGIHESDLHAELTTIRHDQDQWLLRSDKIGPTPIEMTLEPTEATANSILKRVRDASEATHRVEVPFRMIAPPEDELWSASTRDEIRVSLGQSGANRQQYLRLGRGTAQHALVAGKTGSGKSTLMHVLITNLAMWFSPNEIEFYLIDFKKGVEFQIYDQYQLPHAEVIAIESDREFGLSVLQKIDVELKRRGELFRKLGVQDLAGYRDACDDPLPRVLLMIDEFQELFIEDDMITQEATLLMDRLVRQGRAFGMHALLGSQTLDGVYSLARSTMGQMGVRIALQCSEVDSYLILSEDNPHARLLTRPGDAIYNDAGGKLEGNSPFQVVWLNEEDRRASMDAIARKAEATNLQREPFVFRGHVAAELESCHGLMSDLESPCEDAEEPCIWLGDAVAIKPNTCFTLPSVAGANLLILGQNEKAASSLLEASILGLAAQATPHEAPSFIILDGLSQSKGRLAQLAEALPHQTMCPSDHELESTFDALHATLGERLANPRQKHHPLHVVIAGMHGWRGLRRKEDDYSFSAEQGPPKPDAILASVLKEGPSVNIHVLTWMDTINNLTRFLDRTTQREYGNRVLFQMSQMDSSQIIDSTAASRLGENRAVLHREELGSIEKFRPWDKPDMDWLLEQAAKLSR